MEINCNECGKAVEMSDLVSQLSGEAKNQLIDDIIDELCVVRKDMNNEIPVMIDFLENKKE